MTTYQLDVLALQETHIGGDGPEEITTMDGKIKYMIYHSSAGQNGNHAGTAIVVRKGTNVIFRPINDRICLMKVKASHNYAITVINAYAPTLPVSEKCPSVRTEFYDELETITRSVSRRDTLVIAGDFNAKTGRTWMEYPGTIGRYGKGEANSNGVELLEFCDRQNLILTNTLFRHKMAHRTTWESPASYSDKERRNPYRNMIDYIIIRRTDRRLVENARSHNGLKTYTDHRLVRARFDLERLHMTRKKIAQKINLANLNDPTIRSKYQTNIEMRIMDSEDNWNEDRHMNAQERWNIIVNASHKAAEQELGKITAHKDHNPVVQELSDKQKEIGMEINISKDEEKRRTLKRKRNSLMTELHEELGKAKHRKIERQIREIEEAKDDSNRMHKAVKSIQRMKKKEPLVLNCEDGITTDPEKQAEIVTDFFRDMFQSMNTQEIEEIPPSKMREEFTETEVKNAIKSLKDNRSPGIDNIKAEHLKCSPDLVCEKIAELLNHIADTGDFPKELNSGILIPLQKPGKKKGPAANLRPVILLSMLRKILAVCLIRRIGDRIDKEIPKSQAAYRTGRGTTEQLLTIKLLAEKAATTPNYQTTILLMDMSKAFDRVERNTILQDLKRILEEDELHLVKILIKDVKLAVKIDNHIGEEFKTNIGVPQGDCLSPILFTLYLAKAMDQEKNDEGEKENHIELAPHMRDHCYSKQVRTGSLIPLQYADDICWVGTNCEHSISNVKTEIKHSLIQRNLLINEEKTEEYNVRKDGEKTWRKCKYLGTMLGTSEDIMRRKILANTTQKKIHHISTDRRLNTDIKTRAFNAYISSVFLYNSETWTLTKGMADSIDSYHRRAMRNALNVRWPEKMTSERVYEITGAKPWSETIAKRRLRLLGHVMRLPEDTPIRQALDEYERPLKMSRGARQCTWGKNIKNDLCTINVDRKVLCFVYGVVQPHHYRGQL